MSARDDEFYVGYLPAAPPGIARFLRRLVIGLALASAALSLLVVATQRPFAAARFEFGELREFEGTLITAPQPQLLVDRPGASAAAAATSSYLLVGPGKAGASPLVDAFAGQRVRLQGTLVYRGDQTMIEVVPESVTSIGAGAVPPAAVALGEQTLVGEIVDSKCFLGVMNPGERKPHRACATRCISGGIPPILVVRGPVRGAAPAPEGDALHLLLVGPAGESINHAILDRIAEPVEVTGAVERLGERLVLRADPATIRRLADLL